MQTSVNERIKIIRKALKISQSELAELIGITQTSISQLEKGKNGPSVDSITAIVNKLNVSPKWILNGEGEMFESDNVSNLKGSKGLPKGLPNGLPNPKSTLLGNPGIPLVTQRAYGGEPGGFADLSGEDPPLLMLPNMPRGRELIAIQVYGDSMSPSISQGDILITAKVENTLTIKPGKVYVVCVLHNGASVKRLEYIDDLSLHFTSDNPGSPGLTVYKEDIAQMWEWVAQITNWEPSAPTDNLYEISAQFHHLRADVDRILKRLDLGENPV